MMVPWIYRVLRVADRDYLDIQDLINRCADEGWELVTVADGRVYLKLRRW